jgi:putative DNA primase/helicase
MVAEFTTTQSIYLSAAHQQHIAGRGLLDGWARANCRSITAKEASHYLGYTAKSGGILFVGENGQTQFRPDKPWKSPDGKKAPKYRTPVGEYDVYLPVHPTEPNFWNDLEALKKACWHIDGHPYLIITEGPFKAIAGCSGGIPTVALLGVEQGLTGKEADVQGKRYLVPGLEKFARAGIGFIFGYDADAATNKNVVWAQRKLGRQLLKFNVPVCSITGAWDLGQAGETKGMDDFIQKKGIEEFRLLLARSVRFEDWESSLGDSDSIPKFSNKQPPPQELGAALAEDLREQLCYSDSHKSWMKYELRHRGVWSAVNDDYVSSAIDTMCTARGFAPNNAYCANVLGSLKRKLFELDWLERPSNELLPFEDGVLEVENNRWYSHAPGFRLTWSLPRTYQGSAACTGWPAIESWIDLATENNRRKKDILLAFLAASLRGMFELQKFLMLTGPGGTGKGLFTRLATAIVGERNTWIGNLEDLTKADKVADLQTKRLAVFDDQEKYTGNLSNFRSMTGGGEISGRKLYQNSVRFRFPGLALITANQPCFPASGLSWLKRRIVQEEFRYTPLKPNINLEKELQPELSALTRYLLSVPVADIESVLNPENRSINSTFWDDRVRADPLASWVNDCVVRDPTAQTAIGGDKDEWKDSDYVAAKSTLFGSYNHYCRRAGYIPKGKNNFSADLEELCRSVLDWKEVRKKRLASGTFLLGLRLRSDGDAGVPTIEDCLDRDLNAGSQLHDANQNADLKPLSHKACADSVDLEPKLRGAKETEISIPKPGSIESSAGNRVESKAESSIGNRVESNVESSTENRVESNVESDARNRVESNAQNTGDNRVESPAANQVESDDRNAADNAIDPGKVFPPEANRVYTTDTGQGIETRNSQHEGLHDGQHKDRNDGQPKDRNDSLHSALNSDGTETVTPVNAQLPGPAPTDPPESAIALPDSAQPPESVNRAPNTAPAESSAIALNESDPYKSESDVGVPPAPPEPGTPSATDAGLSGTAASAPPSAIAPNFAIADTKATLDSNRIEDELLCVGYIESAIAENDPVHARDMNCILSETCAKYGSEFRLKVWSAFAPDQQDSYKRLLAECEDLIKNLRDIALLWWPESPEQVQSSLAQMFARNAPGDRYGRETIERLLENQEELVRSRIARLYRLAGGEGSLL